jgi:hypothetical protein
MKSNLSGAKLSVTQDLVHSMRDQAHGAHKQAAQTCGCDECQDHLDALNQIGQNDDDTNRYQSGDIIERGQTESITTILDRLQAAGFLDTQQRQMAAAQLAVRPMYNNKV